MDADGSHPVARIPVMVQTVADGAGLVIGSRYVPGASLDARWPWHRKVLSRGGNLHAQVLLGITVKDVTGGFKAWSAQTLCSVDLLQSNASGYAFQIQTTLRAARSGAIIAEVPIHFAERIAGASKMTTAIALEAISQVWTMRRRLAGHRSLS
jgi:dolichol-phosphate mannosyltransferase